MRAFVLSLILVSVPAVAAADKELCEKKWPYNKRPSAKDSQTCMAYYFATYLQGYDPMMDPPRDREVLSRFTAAELRQMAANVPAGKKSDDPTAEDRLKEFFTAGADQWASKMDANIMESIEPLIATAFAGKKLDADLLGKLSFISLVKLRNAPYARHGRPFKNPDLQNFYYTVLKKKQNPDFKDSMLDKVDEQNVALIMKIQKANAER